MDVTEGCNGRTHSHARKDRRTNHFFHRAGLGEFRPQVRPDSHRREEALEHVSAEAGDARPASRTRRRLLHERQVLQHQLVLARQEKKQEKKLRYYRLCHTGRGVDSWRAHLLENGLGNAAATTWFVTRGVWAIREGLSIHFLYGQGSPAPGKARRRKNRFTVGRAVRSIREGLII